jgi:hypothetical protein
MKIFSGSEIREAKFEEAREMVLNNLCLSNTWLARGLVALLNRQTSDEQASQNTRHNNGRGFNSTDAFILTSFAKQCKRWLDGQSKFNSPLSGKQLAIAQRKIVKYASQLTKVAQKKDEPQEAVAV